jgi:hypothetical protein
MTYRETLGGCQTQKHLRKSLTLYSWIEPAKLLCSISRVLASKNIQVCLFQLENCVELADWQLANYS